MIQFVIFLVLAGLSALNYSIGCNAVNPANAWYSFWVSGFCGAGAMYQVLLLAMK